MTHKRDVYGSSAGVQGPGQEIMCVINVKRIPSAIVRAELCIIAGGQFDVIGLH